MEESFSWGGRNQANIGDGERRDIFTCSYIMHTSIIHLNETMLLGLTILPEES